MKVLIVNCYKNNNEGRKLYKAFYNIIVKVFSSISTISHLLHNPFHR